MSDIELAVTRTKTLEALLEQALGATGKGLHEKVSSVQDRLPQPLVKKLRFVATVRNKIVHEASYQKIDDRSGFERACADAESELRAMMAPVAAGPGRRFVWVLVIVALILAAVAGWRLT